MTIAHNHFYTGHGMSIGSETNGGADTIRVTDLSIDGADNGVAQTPDFVRCMPMEKAMHPATLLALKMNGESPDIHGFPARLTVPGWDGTSWVKWVTRLTPVAQQSGGFFMNPGYRYPKYSLPPGTPALALRNSRLIEGMPVKSTLTSPEENKGRARAGDCGWLRLGGRECHRARRGLYRRRRQTAERATLCRSFPSRGRLFNLN
jgi:hypothetical protein